MQLIPHGAPKKEKLQPNKLCLFDLGVMYQSFASDASRTVAFGKIDDQQQEIYKVCLEAQLKAQDAAKPGVTAEELDHIARKVISDAGYGEYFIHRLGHGLGQSDHEFPSIMEGNKMELQPGMCFSIEPESIFQASQGSGSKIVSTLPKTAVNRSPILQRN